MYKSIKLYGIICAFTALFSQSAIAAYIDFEIAAPTSGTLSYAGNGMPLLGTNIQVDNLVGIDTPNNSNSPILCDNCTLTFTTGAGIGNWNFAGGGSISIIGGVPAAGIVAGSTLLNGTFKSASILGFDGTLINFGIVGASFTDTKHPLLIDYFFGNITAYDFEGGLNLSFATIAAANNAFTTQQLFSGDIVNTPSQVPLPAAVWLFGSGLLGIAGLVRRFRP